LRPKIEELESKELLFSSFWWDDSQM